MTEHDMTIASERKIATLEEAEKFARQNVIPGQKGKMCVDGRYEPGQDSGNIATPAGDLGDIEALLLLKKEGKLDLPEIDLTPEVLTERVIKAVNSEGRDFEIHTGAHEDQTNPASVDCAHAAKAAEDQKNAGYGVDANEMKRVIVYLKQEFQQGGRVRITRVAKKDHDEIGILVVKGPNTFNHSNGGVQFFIYDRERDETHDREFVPKLNIPGLEVEEFIQAKKQQREATLGTIAKGLPIFEADTKTAVPSVKKVGTVV